MAWRMQNAKATAARKRNAMSLTHPFPLDGEGCVSKQEGRDEDEVKEGVEEP